jgi:DNA-binding NarL/FixJ family response regulator
VQGSKNSEIARALEITEATVAAHVTSILRKLDVCNRSHAVALALIHHLVPPEENWRSKLEV